MQEKFPDWPKIIMHIDMNAFFASIEQRDNVNLAGKPIAVTNGIKGSCIITCSYEARAFGIKTGMRFNDAKKICPGLIRCPSEPKKYTQVSLTIMNILNSISPDIEIFSIDEAFIDLTNCKKIYPSLMHVALLIKDKILKSVNLPCSIGISANKSNAKFAAKIKKPDGITIMNPDKSEDILSTYKITELCGVSIRMQSFLNYHGVYLCGDMKKIPISILGDRFGNIGRKIWLMAQGKDFDSLKCIDSNPKSIGHGKVTSPNLIDRYEIKKILLLMSEKVGKRMRTYHYESKIFLIGIKIRNEWLIRKFKTSSFINNGNSIFQMALDILGEVPENTGIYQVQVTALEPRPIGLQYEIFLNRIGKLHIVDNVVDHINKKFGDMSIKPARLSEDIGSPDVISPSWRPIGYKKSV